MKGFNGVLWAVVLLAGLVACGGSDEGDDVVTDNLVAGGGVYYGTCDHRPPASGACVDYYCDSESDCSDPAVNGQTTCETGGAYGTPAMWSTTPCPTSGVVGTCSFVTTGDGRLVNTYYTQSDNATESVCGIAGGTWTPGS